MRRLIPLIAGVSFLSFTALASAQVVRSSAKPTSRPVARPAAAQPADTPEPTMEEIKKSFDEGKYQDTLKMLGRVLPLKGKAAAGFDRYELLVLKGETHLRLTQNPNAAAAFGDAADEAEKNGSSEDKDKGGLSEKAAVARATQMIIKRSKGTDFTPKTRKGGKAEPINIADPAQRKTAIAALLADEKSAVEGKISAGLKAKSLPPIAESLDAAKRLASLELAATGGIEGTKKAIHDLGQRGRTLLGEALEKSERDVDEINKNANKIVRRNQLVTTASGVTINQVVSRRYGLHGNDAQVLKKAMDFSVQVGRSAKDLAGAVGDDAESDDLLKRAENLHERAEKTLKADYSDV